MSPQLRAVARRQSGVFALRQALLAGMTLGDVQRRLLDGDWVELQSVVYAGATTPVTHRAACWAAVLALGHPVAVARRSAAHELRLDRAPEPNTAEPELVVPRPRRDDGLRNVANRRADASRFSVVRAADRLPLTSTALTLRELAYVLPRDWVRDMTQHALRRRLVTYSSQAGELGRGLPGAARMRDILVEVAPGHQVVWEGQLDAALRAAGVPFEAQVAVVLGNGRQAVLDLGDRRLRLGVEVDGLVNHLDRFAADRERDRWLILAGWLIVHVAASEVASDLPKVVRHVVDVARVRAHELNLAQQLGRAEPDVSAFLRQVRGGGGGK